VVNLALYFPEAFLSKLSEFPTSSVLLQLAFPEHIDYVFGNGASAFAKQRSHLLPRQPNCFIFEPYINFYVACGALVNEYFACIHFLN
jgi:hypothetical protein